MNGLTNPTTGEAPLLVNFVNLSTGDYDRCEWDFGDKASSKSCINPSHSYLTKGTFTVSLTVSGDGGTDTETKKAYIVVSEGSQEVAANFYGTPTSGQAPLEVTFSNQSTGDYTECNWDFGDGGSSLECDPTPYTYQNEGLYTVSLTVSGDGGDDTETKTDYITVSTEPVPLDADFSALPTSGQAPLEVTFTNKTTGEYSSCVWDFGDGDGSTLCSNIKHTYQAAGIYTVSLTVSGDGGTDEEIKTDYITVLEGEVSIFLPLILR